MSGASAGNGLSRRLLWRLAAASYSYRFEDHDGATSDLPRSDAGRWPLRWWPCHVLVEHPDDLLPWLRRYYDAHVREGADLVNVARRGAFTCSYSGSGVSSAGKGWFYRWEYRSVGAYALTSEAPAVRGGFSRVPVARLYVPLMRRRVRYRDEVVRVTHEGLELTGTREVVEPESDWVDYPNAGWAIEADLVAVTAPWGK